MFLFHAIAGPFGSTHRRTGNNVAALFSRAKSRFLLWRRRRKAVSALEALSDRSLQDMGIARSEIAATVDALLQGAAFHPTR